MMHRGDHACLIYATNGELSLAVAEYLADGLDANERCGMRRKRRGTWLRSAVRSRHAGSTLKRRRRTNHCG
jgi:hypothetical protein